MTPPKYITTIAIVLGLFRAATHGQDLPTFRVSGHEQAMQALNQLFALHHSPRTNCTLWDGWLPMSTLWPAVGAAEDASAEPLREFYRQSLSDRHIDADGYVSMNQHRGLAHPAGWPFPTWPQAAGAGWHFTHSGNGYARSMDVPLADWTGWTSQGITMPEIDRDRGAVFRTNRDESSITSPVISVDAFVSPFVILDWSPGGERPYLQWTTEQSPDFSATRTLPIPIEPGLGKQYGDGLQLCAIPVYRHAEWNGTITQLRVGWYNDAPRDVTLRSLHTATDSRHPITGSLFARGCIDYFHWTGDLDFLATNIARMRRAIDFSLTEFEVQRHGCVHVSWVGHDGRPGFTFDQDGNKQLHHGRGIGNNYWDLLPFGNNDFLATLYLYDALVGLSELEVAIKNHPEWKIHSSGDPDRLASTAEVIRQRGQELFWNDRTGRFVACLDADGVAHDYGFTFLNLEAIHYGFASDTQANRILDWIDGKRIIGEDTSRGEDIYHWRFAPRATTKRNIDWYSWVWHNPGDIPWGGQVQDGGAVLGFSYHDLMARLRVRGPDDAWNRLREILTWFEEVQAEGGYRSYYGKPDRGSLQGGGTPGGLGLDHEFMESILVPQVMLYGFMGFNPGAAGLTVDPKLPRDWPDLTITRIHYQDHIFDLRATEEIIEFKIRKQGTGDLTVRLPGQDGRNIVYRPVTN